MVFKEIYISFVYESVFMKAHLLIVSKIHRHSVLDLWTGKEISSNMCPIDQSHRYGRHQAVCREPAGSYDKTTRTAICFEHKTQYILIRAPYARIVIFWHISNIPPHDFAESN